MRSSAVFVVASLVASGCFDTPSDTRVPFVLTGLGTGRAAAFEAANPGGTPIVLHLTAHPVGEAATQPPLVREVYWDGTDRFAFDVELPAGDYSGFDVEAIGATVCPGGPQRFTLQSGAAPAAHLAGDLAQTITVAVDRPGPVPTCG